MLFGLLSVDPGLFLFISASSYLSASLFASFSFLSLVRDLARAKPGRSGRSFGLSPWIRLAAHPQSVPSPPLARRYFTTSAPAWQRNPDARYCDLNVASCQGWETPRRVRGAFLRQRTGFKRRCIRALPTQCFTKHNTDTRDPQIPLHVETAQRTKPPHQLPSSTTSTLMYILWLSLRCTTTITVARRPQIPIICRGLHTATTTKGSCSHLRSLAMSQ